MYEKDNLHMMRFSLSLILFIFLYHSFFGQELERTDPVKVANHLINLVRMGDTKGILEIMDKDQKKFFSSDSIIAPLEEMKRLIKKDREKIGRKKEVSEIRKCTTVSGKPGIAAKIRKKSGEVYVIILSKEDDIYYYDNILTLTPQAYRELKLIKKIK